MWHFLLSQALFSLRRWAPSPKFVASNKFVGISKDSSANLYRRQWVRRWIFRSSLRRCSIEKMFLNILQNSQENTCARVSFLIKLKTFIRDDTHMTSMKIVQFSTPPVPPPLSSYVQNSSTPLTLDVQFQTKSPPSPYDNQSIKRKQSKDDYYKLSCLTFWLAFVFSINSLILSGFPLICFH